MAPKIRGLSGGTAGFKRKRTVRKHAREPSPVDSSSSSTPAASPVRAAPEVDTFASRVITTGRKVDFELFENEGFHFGRQLIEMSLERICSLDCPTYPALVKEFYKNLARGDDGLISIVRGTNLRVNPTILSRLLDLPLSGLSTYAPEDRSPALTRLLDRNFEDFEEVFANQLPLELRLLHNICSRILFPKTGRFDYVSERDIFVMDHIVSGKPFDLPKMIIGYIADCGSKRKSSLPYGMILTRIFRTQGVLIDDSEPKKELRHTDYYNLATVHRMGFVKKDGHWERKGQPEVRAADADAPGPSERHPSPELPRSPPIPGDIPSPAPAPPAPSVDIPASVHPSAPAVLSASTSAPIGFNEIQLDQLRAILSEQNTELKSEMKILSNKLDNITSILDKSVTSVSSELQKIFERLEGVADGSKAYLDATGQLKKDIDIAVQQIEACLEKFKKDQRDDIMEMIGHLKQIVYKHT